MIAPPGSQSELLATIQLSRPDLTVSERKVADQILADPEAVLDMSIAKLAASAEVSEPTVMRFCAAVGFDGYQSFRIALAQGLAFGLPATHTAIERGDADDVIAEKIFAHSLVNLDRARRSVDPESISRAVEMIIAAEECVFIGHGASHVVAIDAAQKFPLFGKPCLAPSDGHEQHMKASMTTATSLVILISNTGHTRSIVEIAKIAKRNGASALAIVGAEGLVTAEVDHSIVVETEENTDLYTPFTSRLAALLIMDVLATGVAMRQPAEHMARLREMKASLAELRAQRL